MSKGRLWLESLFLACLASSGATADEPSNAADHYREGFSRLVPPDSILGDQVQLAILGPQAAMWLPDAAASYGPDTEESLQKLLRDNADALAQFERATEISLCHFSRKKHTPWSEWSHYTPLSRLADLALLKARFLQKQGDTESALQWCFRSIRSWEHALQDGKGDLFTAGNRLIHRAVTVLEDILQQSQAGEETLRRSARVLENALRRNEKSLRNWIPAQKGELLEGIRQIMKEDPSPEKFVSAFDWTIKGGVSQSDEREFHPLTLFLPKARRGWQRFYRRMNRAVDDLYRPLLQALPQGPGAVEDASREISLRACDDVQQAFRKVSSVPDLLSLAKFVRDDIPRVSAAVFVGIQSPAAGYVSLCKRHAELALRTSAVALKCYLASSSRFPEGLEQLVPEILTDVSRDPFSGAPLHYRRTSDTTAAVWSIGPNLQDDSGNEDDIVELIK